MNEKMSITAIVLTYNEERHIERCVRNLMQVCEKVYVVDSYSSDETCRLAAKSGAIVVQHKYINQAQQFQWALENCVIKTDWTLRLDADEYLSTKLLNEIRTKLNSLRPEITGISFIRNVKFMGRIIRFGNLRPIRILRMWRTGCAYMEQRWMDEQIILTHGNMVVFKNRMIDENLNGLTAWIQKHNDYSNREILVELNKKYAFTNTDGEEFLKKRNSQKSLYYSLPRFFRAFIYFFLRYICFLGFLDGVPGLVWLTLQTYWYRFLVDAKLLEMEKKLGKSPERTVIEEYVQSYYGINM